MKELTVYHYEVLCLDANRTRSIWLTHLDEFAQQQLNAMIDATLSVIPHDTLQEWAVESRTMSQEALDLGRGLGVHPGLLSRLESRADETKVTFSAVLDRVIDTMCATYGFNRLTPTAAVARYGPEVVAA